MFRQPKLFLALTTLILLCFTAPVVNAVTVIVGNGDSISRYPIGFHPAASTSAFPDFGAGGSYQEVYASTAFSGPITITQIAFSSSSNLTSGAGTATYNFNLSLSTSAVGPNALSTDMAANRGGDFVQVFSGPVTATLTANDQFDLVIDITPFTYNPADGNLLLEVTTNSPTQFTGGDILYFRAGDSPHTSRVYNPIGAGAGTDSFALITRFTASTPTGSPATISGQITDARGAKISGVTLRLAGGTSATAISDANGGYRFEDVRVDDFYTLTPELANHVFSPASRSFALVGNRTDAVFTALPDPVALTNVIDTNEFFVRQQYLDFLDREPDQPGFEFWVDQLNQCNGDAACLRQRRVDVSAAFFRSVEFQRTGSYIYRLYAGALGRLLNYSEFAADRRRVVGGANLDDAKADLAREFVVRPEFVEKYPLSMSAEPFADALLRMMRDANGIDLSSERANLITRFNTGHDLADSRARALVKVTENSIFADEVYNEAWVQMEYFGYLRREAEPDGSAFWLNVLNNRDVGNYRGMVCSFITSTEYQVRFGTEVTRSNAECGR